MNLLDWLTLPKDDGSRKRRRDFAARIKVHQTMVTEYAENRAWPTRERWAAIMRETNGQVTPIDHMPADCRELIGWAR